MKPEISQWVALMKKGRANEARPSIACVFGRRETAYFRLLRNFNAAPARPEPRSSMLAGSGTSLPGSAWSRSARKSFSGAIEPAELTYSA
jgi:hypothetical protein